MKSIQIILQMYLKRSVPHTHANHSGMVSGTNIALEAPVVHHIRSVHRPKGVALRNEPHPLLAYSPVCSQDIADDHVIRRAAQSRQLSVEEASCCSCGYGS